MDEDSSSGKLDFLFEEALSESARTEGETITEPQRLGRRRAKLDP
jgi:DNA invertase Pin-like site-specific DNA recombinase